MLIRSVSRLFNNLSSAKKCSVKYRFTKNNFYTSQRSFSKPNSFESIQKKKLKTTLYYVTAAGVVVVGLSYAAVPLYRMFCQAYSYGGTTATGHDSSKVENMPVVKSKPFKIKFNADTAASMRWNFKPQQSDITVSFLKQFLSDIQIYLSYFHQ